MHKVIIVDDSDTMREQLRTDLEGADYQVVEASDGNEGFEQVKNNNDAAVIISDVNMPNMDGVEMITKLKAELENKIPVVMLTTESNEEMRANSKQNGAVAWVMKPYNAEKLLAAVKKIIAMTQKGS